MMEIFNTSCCAHNKQCLIKTGMKPGPNFHKSFYICPESSCRFAREASIEPLVCDQHTDQYVELQMCVLSKSSHQHRVYYRCMTGRSNGSTWCGFIACSDSNKENANGSCVSSKRTTTGSSHRSLQTESKLVSEGQVKDCQQALAKPAEVSSSRRHKDQPSTAACLSNELQRGNELSQPDVLELSQPGVAQSPCQSTVMDMSVAVDSDSENEICDSPQLIASSLRPNASAVDKCSKLTSKTFDRATPLDKLSKHETKSKTDSLQKSSSNNQADPKQSSDGITSSKGREQKSDSRKEYLKLAVTNSRQPVNAELSFSDLAAKSQSNRLPSTTVNNSFTYRDMTVVISSDSDNDDDDDDGSSRAAGVDNVVDDEDKYESSKEELSSSDEDSLTCSNTVTESVVDKAQVEKSQQSKTQPKLDQSDKGQDRQNDLNSKSVVKGQQQQMAPSVEKGQLGHFSKPTVVVPAVVKTDASKTASKPLNLPSQGSQPPPICSQLSQPPAIQGQPSDSVISSTSQSLVPKGSQQPSKSSTVAIPGVIDADASYDKIVAEREKVSKLLMSKKILLQSVNIERLPDGGAKLCQQVDALTETLSQLDIAVKAKQASCPNEVCASTSSKSADFPSYRSQSAGSGAADRPATQSTGARQTLLTDYSSVSSHALKQMYTGDARFPVLYGGRMTESRLLHVGQVTNEAIEHLHEQVATCPDAGCEVDDPSGLKVSLMPHQRQALAWLQWREEQKPPGGILADDMGLGKTLTMISLVLKQRQRDETKEGATAKKSSESALWLGRDKQKLLKSDATLIICPASLVHQWNNEIERRVQAGLVDVVMYHGPNRDCSPARLASATIVLTTYNIVSREVGVPPELKSDKHAADMPAADANAAEEGAVADATEGILLRIIWRRIIIDEAHSIKNHKSLTAQSVCRLRAEIRFALTGTPIQNNLLDMYALLRFLRCSPFDELKVWKRQVDNRSEKGVQRLNTLIKCLLLRRTKGQTSVKTGKPLVALPARQMSTHKLKLSAEERRVYDRLYKESQASVMEYLRQHEEKVHLNAGFVTPQVDQEPNPWAGKDFYRPMGSQRPATALVTKSSTPRGGQILIYLLRLRQCCTHLSIMKEGIDIDALQAEGLDLDLVEQMKDLALGASDSDSVAHEGKGASAVGTVAEDSQVQLADAFQMESTGTKVEELLKLLREIRDKSSRSNPLKSVVVSQWVTMLNVVEYHLNKAGFRCCTIKGNVPVKQRSQIVDSFNSDPTGPTVMLVSLRAGGVGLNLVGGSNLFLLDMHWNPALEQQACDRIYRVGQQRNVFIHKFVCEDTVEERILRLQKNKMALAENVLTGCHSNVDKLTLADLKLLFGLQ